MANAVDVSCAQAGCHAPTNANAMTAVPAAQLDLTDGPSPDEADHLNAYRELLFGDNRQIVMNGALVDEQVPRPGGCEWQPDPGHRARRAVDELGWRERVGPILLALRRRRHARGLSHVGRAQADLGVAHIGAQYYNNPFDPNVPVN